MMRTMMTAGAVVVGLVSAAAAQPKATGESEAYALYKVGLQRFCPQRRLDWVNPGFLIDGIDSYLAELPKETRREIEKRAKPDLAKCEMGAACPNGAYIRAAYAIGQTADLAKAVCRSVPYTCIAPSECAAD